MAELLAGVPSTEPPTKISKSTLENATDFLHHLEGQKGILCEVKQQKLILKATDYSNKSHFTYLFLNAFSIECMFTASLFTVNLYIIHSKVCNFYSAALCFELNLLYLTP